MTTDEDRASRLRRLQERRGAASPLLAAAGPQPADRGPAGGRLEQAGTVSSGRHRAEASRVGAAGAGIVLTLSLMAGMARAERDPIDPTAPQDDTAVAFEATVPPPPAGTQVPIEVAPATPPTTLVVVPVEQRLVVETAPGPTPVTAAGQPAPAPAQLRPQPETASHGSR